MTGEEAREIISEMRDYADLISGDKDQIYEAIDVLLNEVEHYKCQSDQLCERVEVLSSEKTTQSAEITALKLEVARLNQCEVNMKFLLDCLERAELRLPDYTLGTWQDRAKGLAPSIAALRTRLSAIEKAAGEVKAKQRAFYDHPSLAGLTLMRMEDEINTAIDALAALLEKKGDRDGKG